MDFKSLISKIESIDGPIDTPKAPEKAAPIRLDEDTELRVLAGVTALTESIIAEKAVSKAQQKFMGMVHATQKGEKPASKDVAKVAKDMGKKDAKDFASTSHKGLPNKKEENIQKIKEIIRKMVRERMIDEMNVTGNVQGYGTPHAFTKKGDEKKKGKKQADLTGYSVVNENRWLALKQDESSAQAKIGRGISNINKQLKEMERFLNWYGKIKNESGVDNKSYWKRTNQHIYAIKERLIKLDQKIRQISE